MSSEPPSPIPSPEDKKLPELPEKPLKHKASSLQEFVREFDGIALKPDAAEKMAKLADAMQQPDWPASHDAALEAFRTIEEKADGITDLGHKSFIQAISKFRVPNSDTVSKAAEFEIPGLKKPLENLAAYLKKYGSIPSELATLRPGYVKPETVDTVERLTPAQWRAPEQLLYPRLSGCNLPVVEDSYNKALHALGRKQLITEKLKPHTYLADALGNAAPHAQALMNEIKENKDIEHLLGPALDATLEGDPRLLSARLQYIAAISPASAPGIREHAQAFATALQHPDVIASSKTLRREAMHTEWILRREGGEHGKFLADRIKNHRILSEIHDALTMQLTGGKVPNWLLDMKEKDKATYDLLIDSHKHSDHEHHFVKPLPKPDEEGFDAVKKIYPKCMRAQKDMLKAVGETLPLIDGCGHDHKPSKILRADHAGSNKWLALGAGAAAVGVFLINKYGKEPEKKKTAALTTEPPRNLTPAERETQKTAKQQAEDIAYTINHSLYCTLTDFLNPPINAATDGWLRRLLPGCGHDHGTDDGHHHHEHGASCERPHHKHPEPPKGTRWERVKKAFTQAFSKERFIQYAKGEFIGDFGAVPLTIGVQRFFPNFMNGVRKLTEPVMQPIFKYGVERSSKKWAQKNNVGIDSQEYKDHVKSVYDYEMEHFPQAVVWTGFSLGLNVGYQMHADKSNHIPFWNKLALKSSSVLSGVLVTAGTVVAARAMAPHKVHAFDQWTSTHAILPTTKAVGRIFGVKKEDVERMAEKEKEIKGENWAQRTQNSDLETRATQL